MLNEIERLFPDEAERLLHVSARRRAIGQHVIRGLLVGGDTRAAREWLRRNAYHVQDPNLSFLIDAHESRRASHGSANRLVGELPLDVGPDVHTTTTAVQQDPALLFLQQNLPSHSILQQHDRLVAQANPAPAAAVSSLLPPAVESPPPPPVYLNVVPVAPPPSFATPPPTTSPSHVPVSSHPPATIHATGAGLLVSRTQAKTLELHAPTLGVASSPPPPVPALRLAEAPPLSPTPAPAVSPSSEGQRQKTSEMVTQIVSLHITFSHHPLSLCMTNLLRLPHLVSSRCKL